MNNKNFSQKLLKIKQRFKRFNIHDLLYLWYTVLLCLLLLVSPIIKITSLWSWDTLKYRLLSGNFVWTMVIILLCLIVLVWWNFSTKFKNLFLTYFGWRENDSLVNFLSLFVMITAFLSIRNAINIASNATSTISFTWWWNFILIWIFLGIVITLVSVIKWAQKTWKKTKIINVVDDEHRQWEATKEEIKRWLFDDQTVKED